MLSQQPVSLLPACLPYDMTIWVKISTGSQASKTLKHIWTDRPKKDAYEYIICMQDNFFSHDRLRTRFDTAPRERRWTLDVEKSSVVRTRISSLHGRRFFSSFGRVVTACFGVHRVRSALSTSIIRTTLQCLMGSATQIHLSIGRYVILTCRKRCIIERRGRLTAHIMAH